MVDLSLAARLAATLPAGIPGLFNPYSDHCPFEADGPEQRLQRLAMHLDRVPEKILVGEAIGYQGGRYSGIAFTSERLLLAGAIPGLPIPSQRLSFRRLPFSEPSATMVWRALQNLGLMENTVTWNAVQLHPHRLGDVWSNRTPSIEELRLGLPALQILTEAFPSARIVAVGRNADKALTRLGIPHQHVRHPANGGGTLFAEGLASLR